MPLDIVDIGSVSMVDCNEIAQFCVQPTSSAHSRNSGWDLSQVFEAYSKTTLAKNPLPSSFGCSVIPNALATALACDFAGFRWNREDFIVIEMSHVSQPYERTDNQLRLKSQAKNEKSKKCSRLRARK